MTWVLWVDDEQDAFPAVRRVCEESVADFRSAHSLQAARDVLTERKTLPNLLILDTILPWGTANSSSGDASEPTTSWRTDTRRSGFRYVGLRLLDEQPDLRGRTIVLTMVSKDEVVSFLGENGIHHYSKPELALRWSEFRALVVKMLSLR